MERSSRTQVLFSMAAGRLAPRTDWRGWSELSARSASSQDSMTLLGGHSKNPCIQPTRHLSRDLTDLATG